MDTNAETLPTLLKDLIAIPSVNPSFGGTGEAEVANFVSSALSAAGIEPERQGVLPGGRDNIIGRVGADDGQPAILLEAHMDTVGTEGWHSENPFEPVEKDGRIYGRGACDTKASLAVFLALAEHFSRCPETLRQPLVFAASIDEEDAQSGAFRLMEAGLPIDGAITGEPTRLRIVHAHKGTLRFRVRTAGVAAHSAFPERGKNAIAAMAPVLSRLNEYMRSLAERSPHPGLGRPTANIGLIRGGQAVNVVPDSCAIEIDRRLLPEETGEGAMAEIRRLLMDLPDTIVEEPLVARSGLDTPVDSPVAARLATAISNSEGEALFETAPYMTNATAYAAAGIPSLVFGPGDIAQAHTRDEFIEIDQLIRAFRILKRFLSKD